MAMRLKSKWHKKGPKALDDVAVTAGYIAFRVARSTVDEMYGKGFNFATPQALYEAIGEFSFFLLQLAGVQAYQQLGEAAFAPFVQVMAGKIADTLADNQEEGVAPQAREQLIAKINQRLAAYAEFDYPNGAVSYPALRYLGHVMEEVLAIADNRWLAEQVVEVEAPAMIKQFNKGLADLFAQYDGAADLDAHQENL
ncbi:MAG: hypothetical protein HQL49_05185 [Gammaproteobacteria bacterium]|nr:hypothetical protein [Gammaproteobacteria bacterium]